MPKYTFLSDQGSGFAKDFEAQEGSTYVEEFQRHFNGADPANYGIFVNNRLGRRQARATQLVQDGDEFEVNRLGGGRRGPSGAVVIGPQEVDLDTAVREGDTISVVPQMVKAG